PAIFIPYPTAADNHQYLNAKAIVDMGAAWLVKEDNNSHIELLQIIKSIDNDPSILKRFSNILRQEDLDASDNIIKLISKI
ncbi:MAG: glycosyltransferase, partial [Pseudomonadota bacterium]